MLLARFAFIFLCFNTKSGTVIIDKIETLKKKIDKRKKKLKNVISPFIA